MTDKNQFQLNVGVFNLHWCTVSTDLWKIQRTLLSECLLKQKFTYDKVSKRFLQHLSLFNSSFKKIFGLEEVHVHDPQHFCLKLKGFSSFTVQTKEQILMV